MTRIVVIGGGTGLPVLLRGLKSYRERWGDRSMSISAVVSVSDNGGSSGILRGAFGIPAVGDLRNCLVALSNCNPLLADLFQYRFDGKNNLDGHSLGNLIVTALLGKSGSLGNTMGLAADLLRLSDSVLPVTERNVTMCAELRSGAIVRGEVEIRGAKSSIRRVWLDPMNAEPTAGVLEAIASADTIVLGPGSLYSSVISNLLVPKVADSIRQARALKVFVTNLMTEPGETDRLTASEHLQILESYLGGHTMDISVLNSGSIESGLAQKYLGDEAEPVLIDTEAIAEMHTVPVTADLVVAEASKVRHDSAKLADLIANLSRGARYARDYSVPGVALTATF